MARSKRSIDTDMLAAVEAGIAEANRRERGDFDGLLGQLDGDAPEALRGIVSDLRDYLLARHPEDELRALLAEYEPRPGYRNLTPVEPDVELAISLFNTIRSTMRCTNERLELLVLGKGGTRDKKRQAGTRKERRPRITKWIKKQLMADPSAKSPALWNAAPEWLTDAIGERRFATRVTDCRKEMARK